MVVWQIALSLAGVSLLVALLLAAKRWFGERGQTARDKRRAELSQCVFAMLAMPRDPSPESLPPLKAGDEFEIITIALDVLRVTRGRDARRMVLMVQLWGAEKRFEKILKQGSRSQRVRILTLLAHFEDDASLEVLRRHVSDASVYVQLASLRGIAERGGVHLLPDIIRALARATTTNVPMLADILRRFGEPAIPYLASLAFSGGPIGARLAAVRALGNISSLDAYEHLADLTVSPQEALRVEAIIGMGRLGDPRALRELLRGLKDPLPRIRAEAASACGLINLRETIPALAECLSDTHWEVRYRAAASLYRMGAPGLALLRATAQNAGDSVAGEMARDTLSEMEGVQA